jgi:D-serine deaminase-like pyridoxal phosphate-dependent protein
MHIRGLGGVLRPHVKTAKAIDVVRRALHDTPGGITVSTLKEAEYFFAHGIRDIVYAVGIAPAKFAHVFSLTRNGAQLKVIADNLDAVRQLAQAASDANVRVPVLIELDVDGHRSGVHPDSQLLLDLGKALTSTSGVTLAGVLTHAGDSYSCRGAEALTRFAERERAGAVGAAQRLRSAGYEVPIVSVGSTPTGTFTRDLSGVTEVRAVGLPCRATAVPRLTAWIRVTVWSATRPAVCSWRTSSSSRPIRSTESSCVAMAGR